MKRWLMALATVVSLVGCGGGGGSAGTSVFDGNSGGGTTGPAAADLMMTSSATQLNNTASSTVTVEVTAVDASRVAVADAPVTVSADSNAVVVASSNKTDSSGKLTATVSIGTDRSNRVITVKATSGTVEKTLQLQVVGTTVSSTLVPAVVSPSGTGEVIYLVKDAAGNAMANQAITIEAPGLTPSTATGTTGVNGDYKFSYTAPATSGNYKVSAMSGGAGDEREIQVQQASSVPPVATAITSASASSNPSVVSVNTVGSQANRSEIRVLFLSANNQPIKNVRVKFDLAGDVNSIGGTFSTTSNTILYSDSNGVVTTSYIPGNRASPTGGVTVRACYGTSDTDPNLTNCTTSTTTTLTVTNEALGVSIGTNELISESADKLAYIKQYQVSVVDSAGVAKPDVNLSVSVDLPKYHKGGWVVGSSGWVRVPTATCLNEDDNRNGVLETGEDLDQDNRLDPGKSDVSVLLLQSKTRADGTAVVQIQYPKSFGSWVDAWITVSASGVSGTEGRATYVVAPVPVPADSIKNTSVEPAFVRSPYGTAASCSDPN